MASRKRPPRTRPIRLTLAGLFIVPLVTLVALWGFAASVTLSQAIAKRNLDTLARDTGGPGQAVLVQIAQERLQSFIWLGSGRRSPHAPVELQREQTDAAVAAFKRGLAAGENLMPPAGKQNLGPLLSQIGQLPGIRNAIDFGAMGAPQAFEAYNGIVDALFRFFDAQAVSSDVGLYREAVAAIEMGRALEMAGREAALVGGALAARGQMNAQIHDLFVQTLANQRFLEADGLSKLNAASAAVYVRLFASPAYATFKAMEDQISAGPGGGRLPVSAAGWQAGAGSFLAAFTQAGGAVRLIAAQGLRNAGNVILLRLALAAGAGLIAVFVSALLLLRFGRRITRELVGLREAARTLADERLPRVVNRLRRGEDVDVSAEAPPMDPGKTTEIANVTQAFSTVQWTAVEAAVGQAQLRKGVNQVFLNLARRNQSLLHRQLDMLDSMERATSDPEALENFFRLDHLTTRMRRHAEGLIILSGEVPGRGWRNPVRVLDVLRAAISEVEDYVRVDIINESRDAVVGTAVADVIHLLAELIENATAFSPPNTRVTVSADRVGSGFAVEIEDRGLGIGAEELAEINRRLANPPEFDLADSDQLGLFVVGQLAARHQIKVSLVESPFGGTLAVVLMPPTIVVSEAELGAADGDGHTGSQAALEMGESLTALPAATAPPPGEPASGSADGWQRTSPPMPGEPDGTRPEPVLAPSAGLPRVPWPDTPGAAPVPVGAMPGTHDALPDPLDVPDPWRETPVAPAPWLETPGTAGTWRQPRGAPATPRQLAWPPAETPIGAAGPRRPDHAHTGSAAAGGPAGAAVRPAPATARPAQPGYPAEAARMGQPADPAGTHLGLPRRIRQASLAPQLRAPASAPVPEAQGPASAPAPSAERPPEEARAIMTSLQQGWQRGRADAEPSWEEGAPPGPSAMAPGEDGATDAEGRDAR